MSNKSPTETVRMNNYFLTPQEHYLIGSTMLEEKYIDKPYTPLAVQDGISIETCDKKRQQEGELVIACGAHWGLDHLDPTMRLERLNYETGETVYDPAIIKHGTHFEGIGNYSKDFPHARESVPRVELKND